MKHSWMQRIFVFALMFILPASGAGQGIAAPDAPAAPEPGIAPGWLVQHADAPLSFSDMSQHSLRLDSSGYPRMVYGGDHLYYAYLDTSGLHTETADSAWNVGSGAALALDIAGRVHISYYDADNNDLKYATNKSGAWQVQTVASTGNVGRYSDIAIDAWGDPAIVYFDNTNSQLRYIYYDSEYGGWGPDVVAATDVHDPRHTGWFSFALDTSVTPNKPHISFYKTAGSGNYEGALYYATGSNGWVPSVLEYCSAPDTCHAGEYNSIALSPLPGKHPSVAYSYDGIPSPMLIYQSFTGTGWSKDYLWSALPSYVTLGFDKTDNNITGKAHITYKDGGFMYTRQTGVDTEPWSAPYVIDGSAASGEWSSMAVIGTTAKALHYDTQARRFVFVDHDRNGWKTPSLIAEQGREVGECSSLAVDRLGRAHTSYWDSTNKRLLYARYDGTLPWFKNTIDSSGTAGCFSVMRVDPATNNPVVAFVRGTDLYYATYNAAMETWQSPILINSGLDISYYSYQHLGMALRPDSKPVFAYIKGSNLIYTSWNGTNWSNATVTASPAATHVALALDSSNHPHILFDKNAKINNATNPGTGWVIESLGDPTKSYYGVAVAAGPSGQVSAAFLSTGGYQLHYASRACGSSAPPCGWTAPVMADIECEENFSLALDTRGMPHMACPALISTGFELHYITRSGSAWAVQVVDASGQVGEYAALALSPSGRPRISYHDYLNHDLKFAQALDKVYLPGIIK